MRVCSCSSERSTSRLGLANSDGICAEEVATLISPGASGELCCESALWCDILLKLSLQVNRVSKLNCYISLLSKGITLVTRAKIALLNWALLLCVIAAGAQFAQGQAAARSTPV